MRSAVTSSFVVLFAIAAVLVGSASAQDPADLDVPKAAVHYAITTDKIADVKITEESPGRFIAVIQLVEAQKKVLSQATSAHVGEYVEVTIAGEAVLRTEIRGPMDTISLGPWMNEGLANLFARCLTRCGPKNCL